MVDLPLCSPLPYEPLLVCVVVSARGANTVPPTVPAALHTAQAVVPVLLVLVGAAGQEVLVPVHTLRTSAEAATAGVGAEAVPEAECTRTPTPRPAPGAATAVLVVVAVHGTARAQPPLMGLPSSRAHAVVAASPVPAVCTPRFPASSAA